MSCMILAERSVCLFFPQAMLLLVHINPKLIWKVQLTSAPESLEHLYNELQERLEGDFCLQYEDPDFGQAVQSD